MPDGQGLAAVLEKGEQKKGKKQMCPASVGEKVRDKMKADAAIAGGEKSSRANSGLKNLFLPKECMDIGMYYTHFG